MTDFYGTSDGFLSYCDARDRSVSHSDAKIEAALLVASEWIDGAYRSMFYGLKVGGRDQVREWPRTDVMDIYGYSVGTDVPNEIVRATYEAAFREMEEAGSLVPDFTPSKYKRVSIDGAISVEYSSAANALDLQPDILVIDRILAPILWQSVNAGSSLTGASVLG